MNSAGIRKKFLDFFKKNGHKIISSSSLVPNDSTVLFTSAGMQQLAPYLSGEKDVIKDFGQRHLASCQKCLRTGDIDAIGDDTHHTFFEMLGNWSIGQDKDGYFKEKAIKYSLDFLCNVLKLEKKRLWVTIFKGDGKIPRDEASLRIWQENGIPRSRIREFGMEDNFWGPVRETGPCGPCTEIHYDRGEKFGCGRADCGPNCPYCQRFVEVWNLVFMEYDKQLMSTQKGKPAYIYKKLPQKNVDTGMGFERLISILEKKPSAYETDIFSLALKTVIQKSPYEYDGRQKQFRILVDHLRAVIFLAAEGLTPSNLGRGYILRRILRRIMRYAKELELPKQWYVDCIKAFLKTYQSFYPELLRKESETLVIIQNEEEKFQKTLRQGLKEFKKLIFSKTQRSKSKIITGREAFELYETYGFPLEFTKEMALEQGFGVEEKEFKEALEQHRIVSRRGAKEKFGGHGIKEDNPSFSKDNLKIIRLHTATHLLQAALRKILGKEVSQKGSDINAERLRFDFSFNRKLTQEEIRKVEDLVNGKIRENLKVRWEKMPKSQALASKALAFFPEKYPDVVRVYTIFNPETGEVFSQEICAGPHVESILELGKFKIIKENSLGRGIRRIKAILK